MVRRRRARAPRARGTPPRWLRALRPRAPPAVRKSGAYVFAHTLGPGMHMRAWRALKMWCRLARQILRTVGSGALVPAAGNFTRFHELSQFPGAASPHSALRPPTHPASYLRTYTTFHFHGSGATAGAGRGWASRRQRTPAHERYCTNQAAQTHPNLTGPGSAQKRARARRQSPLRHPTCSELVRWVGGGGRGANAMAVHRPLPRRLTRWCRITTFVSLPHSLPQLVRCACAPPPPPRKPRHLRSYPTTRMLALSDAWRREGATGNAGESFGGFCAQKHLPAVCQNTHAPWSPSRFHMASSPRPDPAKQAVMHVSE